MNWLQLLKIDDILEKELSPNINKIKLINKSKILLLITLICIPIKYPGGFILYILIIKDKQITDTETGFNMIDL